MSENILKHDNEQYISNQHGERTFNMKTTFRENTRVRVTPIIVNSS